MALVKIQTSKRNIERLKYHYDVREENGEVVVFNVRAFPEFIRHVKDGDMEYENMELVSL